MVEDVTERAGSTAAESLQELLQAMSALRPAVHGAPGPGLPVAHLQERYAVTANYYVVTTVDSRGRLADRSALRVLGWQPLRAISITCAGDLVLVVSKSGGDRLTGQGHLRLPVGVRRSHRLRPGSRLLLVACPGRALLALYPASALEAILAAHHRALLSGGHHGGC